MNRDEMDSKLRNVLKDLKSIPLRNPQSEINGKAKFMNEALILGQSITSQGHHRPPVSKKKSIFLLFHRQHLLVKNPLIAIILAVLIFFGGSAVSVYAAQDSLPNQVLYPVKTWSEDTILSLTGSPQLRLTFQLDFSDRRVAEMTRLLAAGNTIPDGVETRLQNELDSALELAAGMDDAQAKPNLEQVRQHAEAQFKTMTLLLAGGKGSAEPLLLMAQGRLQEQIQLSAMGESDIPGFRIRIQQRIHNREDSRDQIPGTGNGSQDPGPKNPTHMPGHSGTPTRNGSMSPMVSPTPSGTSIGAGLMSPNENVLPSETSNGEKQPGGSACPCGSSTQTPTRSPQPRRVPGHGP
jgi:hypothetical protein